MIDEVDDESEDELADLSVNDSVEKKSKGNESQPKININD